MPDLTYAHLVNNNQYNQLNLGTAYASSTTLTDVSPGGNTAGQAFQWAGDTLQLGQQFHVRVRGIVSNTGTPNLTLGLYYGGVAGVALATTGALASLTGLSNALWTLEADLRVDGVGVTGAIRTLGTVIGPFSGTVHIPATSASGNSVTVDTSSTKLLTVGATWGTNSASNTLQVVSFAVVRLDEGGS